MTTWSHLRPGLSWFKNQNSDFVKSINKIFFIAVFLFSGFQAFSQLPAFPGAEGFGKFAVGGRFGSVYHVTNLNDSGTGSLRDAVSKPNRIVVFDVAGVIRLNSRMVFASNLYVAGQTAPGEGIIVYGDGVSFSGASNTIVRYLRFRMGKVGTDGADAAGIANGTNMIFDHLSVSWGLDETFSISPDGKGSLGNITIQNSIIGQGFLSHSAGGLIQADNITLYRNLYIDNSTRNPKVKGKNQFVNNIVYNWKNAAYIMGGDSEGNAYCNAHGNLFIKGPSGGGSPFSGGNSLFHLYAADNWYDNNTDGVLNPYSIPRNEYSGAPDFQEQPYNYPALPTLPALKLKDSLQVNVGASLPYRDIADYFMINELKSLGKQGKILSEEVQLPFGPPSTWSVWAGNSRLDTDNDGMPDEWEKSNGTNFQVNDAMIISANGYANIENYINSIDITDKQDFLRTPVCFDLQSSNSSSLTLSWFDYTDGEEGFSVEMEKNGVFTEIFKTAAEAVSVKIDSLTPATAYKIRARAFRGDKYSEYTKEMTFKTQPLLAEVIDPATFNADLLWSVTDGKWDFSSLNWNNSLSTFANDKSVMFAQLSDVQVQLDDSVKAKAIVVKDDYNLTLNGSGSLTGSGSLNKSGNGTLKIGTLNKYTGASVIWGGVVEFPVLANGGQPSSLGASLEFAQNWIWKGGTWKYTGGTASTDRSAIITDQTAFEIANQATTVTFNGSLEGNGDFVLDGKGTLKITKPFNFTGNTILKGGTLFIEGSTLLDQQLGSSPKLVLAGGSYKTKDINDRYGNYNFPIEVVDNTYSTFSVHRNCSINSKVSGSGTLEYQVAYLREYVKGNWNDFTGTLVANGVNTSAGNCQLLLYNGNGIPNAVVKAKGNLQILSWATTATYYLGGLSGPSGTFLSGASKNTTTSTMTWIVGGANTDETFNGVIDNRCSASGYNGTTSIVKNGDGYWRLTGTNVYKGSTIVNEGMLIVNGNHTGTGAVTVKAGATLAGTGSFSGPVSVLDAATLKAGDTLVNNSGLSFKAGLNLFPNTATEISLMKSGPITKFANKITVIGSAKLNGVLKLNVDKITYPLSEGNYFDIFNFANATVTGQFTAVQPAVPAAGFEWDTSKLYTEGRIYIRKEGFSSLDGLEAGYNVIFPTLVNNVMEVKLPVATGICKACIFDNTGKMRLSDLIEGSKTIDLSAFDKGMYYISLTDKSGNMTVKKFVKQ